MTIWSMKKVRLFRVLPRKKCNDILIASDVHYRIFKTFEKVSGIMPHPDVTNTEDTKVK